jgi:phage terminase small subunit
MANRYNPKPTRKQLFFVAEYLVDLNGTQAAIRAGFSPRTAAKQAPQLLARPCIQTAIREAMEDREKRTNIRSDKVLREIARIGFSDIRKAFDDSGELKQLKELDDDTAAAISSIEIISSGDGSLIKKIKVWDKNSALEKLCKHLGLYDAEKLSIDLKAKVEKIVVQYVDTDSKGI